jgi:hypothetical protein
MSEEFNLEDRILCEDDTCIGLVGNDGRCKICGRTYQGPLPLLKGDDGSGDAAETDEPEDHGDTSLEATDEYSDERVPCVDDLCIGVIGPDGKCGTCGKSA